MAKYVKRVGAVTTKEQAAKVALSMLRMAKYEPPFITLHPIETYRDGRETTLRLIAQALSKEIGIDEGRMFDLLTFSNAHNAMVLNDGGEGL